MNRELDGIYFRVERDGKWQNICFSDMTEKEMYKVLDNKNREYLLSLSIQLGKAIREIGDEFNIICGRGDDDE